MSIDCIPLATKSTVRSVVKTMKTLLLFLVPQLEVAAKYFKSHVQTLAAHPYFHTRP